ncbi:class I SAM-dependent methyltransferase [Mycobacterium sp. ITM-2016-00317]|uniref:class I SAM-dependent methyltransferase n=1 Tax=Mycobacterium sp. ITM-2016-00317 TaxID=2099694 RepID=UPI00287F8E8F|nr:class I SAM-dependent methyltransferase [Mycobacterium sp. ITM-2016-00317]WNG87597.1 class I SAM-dependent methyltransferase [Mycobacterium sp. ITM-2016-00317]
MTHAFDAPRDALSYADRVARIVPMYRDVHRLAAILMAEHAPTDARILVLGAGGGLETKSFADAQPGWTFDAVDPAAAMLDLAAETLAPHSSRVRFHHGYIDDAPPGPFAAATSLLTLHFLEPDERLRTAAAVRQRLSPGAPFVVVHASIPQRDAAERALWMHRHRAGAVASGIDPADADKMITAVNDEVPVLTPAQDRAILEQAGFTEVTEFFTAFIFRGWVGYA